MHRKKEMVQNKCLKEFAACTRLMEEFFWGERVHAWTESVKMLLTSE